MVIYIYIYISRYAEALASFLFAVLMQTLFQYVTGLMRKGYHEECSRQRHLALSPKDGPEKRNTAL